MSFFAFVIPSLGVPELMLVLVIVLVVFGAGRLPQVFESLGKGLKSFKDAQRDEPVDVTPPKSLASKDGVSEAHEVREKV